MVGVIGPWNFPLNNSFGDCIPALAAGNAVILKPSEVTPLTSLLLAEMLTECGIPDGVFQIATGRGETGAALIDGVDFVMFTGSVETGKKVMGRAAQTLTPVALELGGKDPMIVLEDADIERATNAAVAYGLNNSGQVCISVERIYVEEPVHDEFVQRLTEKVGALRQGPPGPAGSVDVGAIIFPPQLELIDAHVKDAVEKGADVLTGGKQGEGPGRFYRADRAHRRRPLDALHDGGDLRPDAPGDEGQRRGGGPGAGERRSVRAPGIGVDARHRARRGAGAADRGRSGGRQRHADELRRAGAADGRLEVLGHGFAPRTGRDPQVHEAAVDPGHARQRALARDALRALRGRSHRAGRPAIAALVTSEMFTDAQRATLTAFCDTIVPALAPPAEGNGAGIRTASGLARPPTSASPRRSRSGCSRPTSPEEQLDGLRSLIDALAEEGMAAQTPQEAREQIVLGLRELEPGCARRNRHPSRPCLSHLLRAPRPRHRAQPELGRDRLPGPADAAADAVEKPISLAHPAPAAS